MSPAAFVGLVLMPVGLVKAQEVGAPRALVSCVTVATLLGITWYLLLYT